MFALCFLFLLYEFVSVSTLSITGYCRRSMRRDRPNARERTLVSNSAFLFSSGLSSAGQRLLYMYLLLLLFAFDWSLAWEDTPGFGFKCYNAHPHESF